MAIILLFGEIVEGDAETFRIAINGIVKAGYILAEVRLNSIGGSLSEGTGIARLVRIGKFNTRVPTGATCASVCFLAFAAGAAKSVDTTARLGVHVASDESGEESEASKLATAAMGRIASVLGVPSDIIGRMVSTPATQMFWLSRSDLSSMGAMLTD